MRSACTAASGLNSGLHMSDDINIARRGFLASGLLAASAWRHALASAGLGLAGAPGSPLLELAYGQVQFDAGPVDRQARENHRLLLGLDEDALLRPFRER